MEGKRERITNSIHNTPTHNTNTPSRSTPNCNTSRTRNRRRNTRITLSNTSNTRSLLVIITKGEYTKRRLLCIRRKTTNPLNTNTLSKNL